MKMLEFLDTNYVIYGTIGYFEDTYDVEKFIRILINNLPVIEKCSSFILVFNVTNNKEVRENIIDDLNFFISKYIPIQKNIIVLDENRGHTFGTMDLDLRLFEEAKELIPVRKYLLKTSADVIFFDNFLEREVIPDFAAYVMNSFSYETLAIKKEISYPDLNNYRMLPQTNFYILDLLQHTELYSAEEVNRAYNKVNTIERYNGKPWEYIENFSCEHLLQKAIGYRYYNFLTNEEENQLMKYVYENKVGDPSHKNIAVAGVCHYQYTDKNVIFI